MENMEPNKIQGSDNLDEKNMNSENLDQSEGGGRFYSDISKEENLKDTEARIENTEEISFTDHERDDYAVDNREGEHYSEPIATENKSIQGVKTSFYKESYSKKKKKIKHRYLLVAVGASILGGIITGLFLQFVSPAMKPAVAGYINGIFTNNNVSGISTSNDTVDKPYTKIEIQKSESPIAPIAEKVGPTVVGIKTTVVVNDSFFGSREAQPEGSGIIIKSNGYIMTNNHVIADAIKQGNELINGAVIQVFLPSQIDKPYAAKIIGRDEKTDLAVLKIEAENLPTIEMGDSDTIKVGELAVAIGNPGGLEYMGSVTSGIISGLNRTVDLGDGKELKLIQTDAAINPGNSGGALVNSEGKLIGVNTAKIGGSGYEGLGFAIPVNKAKEITNDLIEFKYVKGRPFLGIQADPRFNKNIAKQYNVPSGVLIYDVVPLSGAYAVGIKRGDIITKFAGQAVTSLDELNQIKEKYKPNDTIEIEVYRDNNYQTLKLKLTEEKLN